MRIVKTASAVLFALPFVFASPRQQFPFAGMPGNGHATPFAPSSTSLSDLLTVTTKASMFYSYARDVPSISARLSSPVSNSTLIVPTDEAIMSLIHKPHQGRPVKDDIEIIKDNEQSEKDANAYLEEWVKRHIVPRHLSQHDESTSQYPTMLADHTVSFEKGQNHQEWFVNPGHVSVLQSIEASNGVIILVNGALPLDDN